MTEEDSLGERNARTGINSSGITDRGEADVEADYGAAKYESWKSESDDKATVIDEYQPVRKGPSSATENIQGDFQGTTMDHGFIRGEDSWSLEELEDQFQMPPLKLTTELGGKEADINDGTETQAATIREQNDGSTFWAQFGFNTATKKTSGSDQNNSISDGRNDRGESDDESSGGSTIVSRVARDGDRASQYSTVQRNPTIKYRTLVLLQVGFRQGFCTEGLVELPHNRYHDSVDLQRDLVAELHRIPSASSLLSVAFWHVFYERNDGSKCHLPKKLDMDDGDALLIRKGSSFWLFEWIVICRFVIERKQERVRIGITMEDTIGDLKRKLISRKRIKKTIPIDLILLFYDGTICQDDSSKLKDCGICGDETIMDVILLPSQGSTVQISSNQVVFPLSDDNCAVSIAPEYRGITIVQLIDVAIQILLRCSAERWTSADPSKNCKDLRPEEVTLYDLVHHYIKPMTQSQQCSYLEAVAVRHPNTPQWFVSHWWGDSVFDMISCLRAHAFDRDLDPATTTYWVCAYALNQHKINLELENSKGSLQMSPFYKAMKLTQGMVSILDGNCVCYSRIWCCYEVSLALKEFVLCEQTSRNLHYAVTEPPLYLYDVYIVTKRGLAVGLTDGFAARDKLVEGGRNKSDTEEMGYWSKRREARQALFPLSTSTKALAVQIEEAEASRPEDRRQILNAICGNTYSNQELDPPILHSSYDEVNSLLRGKFAMSTYRDAVEQRQDMRGYRAALSRAPLAKVSAIFHHCAAFRLEAAKFALSLPSSVEELELDYSNIPFESSDEFSIGFGRLANVLSFKLVLKGHHATTNSFSSGQALWQELGKLSRLRMLDLDFGLNQRLTSFDGLVEAIRSMTSLETLSLNFALCPLTDKSVTHFAKGLVDLQKRRAKPLALDLHFTNPVGACCFGGTRTLEALADVMYSGQAAKRIVERKVKGALEKLEVVNSRISRMESQDDAYIERHNKEYFALLQMRTRNETVVKPLYETTVRSFVDSLQTKYQNDPLKFACGIAVMDFDSPLKHFYLQQMSMKEVAPTISSAIANANLGHRQQSTSRTTMTVPPKMILNQKYSGVMPPATKTLELSRSSSHEGQEDDEITRGGASEVERDGSGRPN